MQEGRERKRWGPPAELGAPPARLRPWLHLLWYLCLALALFSQAGTTWRVQVHYFVTAPPYASLGLVVTDEGVPLWKVHPVSERGPTAEKLKSDARIVSIDGRPIRSGETAAQVSRRLAEKGGAEVKIGLAWEGGANVVLTRKPSAEWRRLVNRASNRAFMMFGQAVDLVVAFLLIAAATILWRRKGGDPVAILLSFALLFAATLGTEWIWAWLELPLMPGLLKGVWIALFLIAMPAFPSGRYSPDWTRWMMVAGPVGAVLIAYPALGDTAQRVQVGLILALALLCLLPRLRGKAGWVQLQKAKWAALALTGGFLLYALGLGLSLLEQAGLVETAVTKWIFYYLGYALTRLAFVVIAAGLLAAILQYRLHDADAAIGRSVGYALVTTIVAVVWAASETWMGGAIKQWTGGDNPASAAAASTVLALLVFAPARSRILGWTERRFQQAITGLRSVPDRLLRWQHEDDPETVARRAIAAIAKGMGADSAALAVEAPDGPEIVAAFGVEPDVARQQLSGHVRTDPFPLRFQIEDCPPAGLLAIGRRSRGGAYSTAEQRALADLVAPLADLLRAVGARASRNGRVAQRLETVTERLERLEGRGPTASGG